MIENTFSYQDASELNMYYCGKRIHTPNHSYGPEIRTYFLIVLVKEGYGTFLSAEEHIRLCPGDIIVMFPNEKIHYVVDKNSLWSISWIGVYGHLVYDYFDRMGVTAENPIIKTQNPEKLSDILEEIFQSSYSSEMSGKVYTISLLYKFFSELLTERKSKRSPDYAAEAAHIIDYNYDKNITVEKIAETLHVNPSYLSRIFKEQKNISPKEYILNKKIECAKQMLKLKELRINEISVSLGFADPLYFSRLFKSKTGMSPSEYAKM